jgi:hypothetical protein
MVPPPALDTNGKKLKKVIRTTQIRRSIIIIGINNIQK